MSTSETTGLRPEIRMMLALADLELGDERVEYCRSSIADQARSIDWGFFVDQAARHRILPLVSKNIIRHGLHLSENGAYLIPYHWLYPFVYHGNESRNQGLAAEFGSVIRALNAANIAYAIRKGPVLGEWLYGDAAIRPVNDLDVLVERGNVAAASAVLNTLGYTQGRLSAYGKGIEPFSRRTQVFWHMNVDNELPYLKLAGQKYVETYIVDICFDISKTFSESSVGLGELLERRIPLGLCGEQGFALALTDQFIDLCANLHMEATALYYVADGGDVEILKFLDIALSCRQLSAEGRWAEVRERVHALGALESVYYALHYTALLYPDSVPPEELVALRPVDCRYLDEYGAFEGKPQQWRQPFLHRLFDPRRPDEVQQSTSIPRL